MTVANTTRKAGPFAGNGVTTSFPFTFKVFTTADIELTHEDGDGVQTVLVLDSDYSVTLNGDQDVSPGGTITYPLSGSPLPTGERLIGVGSLEYEQTTDITNLGSFNAQVHEDAFDRQVILTQQLAERAGRTITAPVGDATDMTLPTAADRANTVLGFDADGNLTVDPDIGASVAAAATSATGAAASAAAAAEDLAEAEEVLEQTRTLKLAAEAARNGLIPIAYEYEKAFLIDATTEDTDAAVITKEGDAVTEQALDEFFTFSEAAMVVAPDGSRKWSPHNLVLQSGNLLNAAYSGSGLTKSSVFSEGPRGAQTAIVLTTATSPATLSVTLSGTKISKFSGGFFLGAWKVEYDGTHRWAYLRIDSPGTLRVYFDLQNGVVGTADAGITGFISRYDTDGTLLPSGWFMIYAYQMISAASFDFKLGLSDANANPAITAAKTLRVDEPQVCYGVNPQPYMATTAVAVYGTPYTWERGGRTMMNYGGAVYTNVWSEDATNAAWSKTNCTPTLDAIGVSGEPCSRLTFTADNGTCTFATTSTGTSQTYAALVRRKVGTGPIYMTMDAVELDITAQINASTFEPFYMHGTTANPVIGFKGGTSGDEIEFCHANNTKTGYVMPPLAVHGTAITMNGITHPNVSVPISIEDGTLFSYTDLYLTDDTALMNPGTSWEGVVFTNSADATKVAGVKSTLNLQDGNVIIEEIPTDRVTYPIYVATSAGERIEATLYLAGSTGGNYCSINGEPPAIDYMRNITGLNRFSIGGNGAPMQFLRKFLVASTTLADRDEVRTKHYQQGIRNNLYASAIVAGDSEFAALTNGTDMNRQPVVQVLKDYGDSALIGVFWIARSVTPYDTELPTRLMQRNFVYDRVANTLVPVTNAAVAYQPTRWTSALGGVYASVIFRVPSGANAGRLVAVIQLEDSVSGTSADMDVNVYMMTNDLETDGYPATGWTTPVKIFDSSTLGSAYMIVAPGGDHVITPPNDPVAPNRVIVPFYLSGNRVGCFYTDDFGGAWTLGNLLTVPAPGASEPTLARWPDSDGTIVMTLRAGNGLGDNRQWAKSVDGGETLVLQGTIPNIAPDSDCSASTVQLDPTGLTGPQGRIAMSRASLPFRKGFVISFATDDTMEQYTQTSPFNASRYFGYSGSCGVFGYEFLAVAVEGGYSSGNLDNSVTLAMVKV